jgi:hypothetical protein
MGEIFKAPDVTATLCVRQEEGGLYSIGIDLPEPLLWRFPVLRAFSEDWLACLKQASTPAKTKKGEQPRYISVPALAVVAGMNPFCGRGYLD